MANNKLKASIKNAEQTKRIGLMCHAVFGYPSIKQSVQLVDGMISAGVDVIELQIPFSDPVADGPTIMRANQTALEQDATTEQCFKLIKPLARGKVPIVLMAYFQTIYAYGLERFVNQAVASGISGVIVPDLPPEEDRYEDFERLCRQANLDFIPVISPNAPTDRIAANAKRTNSFIYCTARAGITGSKTLLGSETQSFLRRVRRTTPLPRALGFGISAPAQVKILDGQAELAVVGSAIVKELDRAGTKAALKLVKSLVAATV